MKKKTIKTIADKTDNIRRNRPRYSRKKEDLKDTGTESSNTNKIEPSKITKMNFTHDSMEKTQ